MKLDKEKRMTNKLAGILTIAALLNLSTVALAEDTVNSNIYVGANLGYSDVELPDFFKTALPSWKTSGLGYNVHGGYLFNQYLGIEVGYTKYADAKGSGTEEEENVSKNIKYQAYSFDIAAKGFYRVNPKWSLFGKAGFGYLTTRTTASSSDEDYGNQTYSHSKFAPLVGVGTNYLINDNTTMNIGYTFIYGGTAMSNDIDSTNILKNQGNYSFLSVGMDYRF